MTAGAGTLARAARARMGWDWAIRSLMWLTLAFLAMAASPSPTAAPGGDPRSSGQGPGLVGDPVVALVLVLAIGFAAVALTLAYIRMTPRRPD